MKHFFRSVAPVLAFAVSLSVLRAADNDRPTPQPEPGPGHNPPGPNNSAPAGGPRFERRGIPGHPADRGEKESVTFLGLETAPITATLTAQLGLPDGAGLVVAHLEPGSPAAGAL